MQLSSLIGKKIYQKQGFLQDGTRVPLSGVVVAGNFVTQVKSADKEGYNALQLGMGISKKAKKAIVNHSKKAGLEQTPRFFREIRVDDVADATSGTAINVSDVFTPGDIVDVTGVSKGKGFAGGVKRHHFKGGPKTHGQSDRLRAPGSIGQTTTPGRVYKGKRMAGRMGHDTVTVKNLEVIEVTDDGVLLIKGLVPGALNSIVVVKKMGTDKKFVPLYKEKAEEATNEESASRSSVPEDAQQVKEETPKSEATSLNDSQQSDVVENRAEVAEPAINSSGDAQAPSAQNEVTKDKKEAHPMPEATEGK
jgi:large subunit ribosomal protein L3